MNLTQVKTLAVVPVLTMLGNALHAMDVPAAVTDTAAQSASSVTTIVATRAYATTSFNGKKC